MNTIASQIIGISIICSTISSGTDQRKHQSSASLAFMRGIHWWPVDSLHKGPVMQEMFPFDELIMGQWSVGAVTGHALQAEPSITQWGKLTW